MLFWNTQKIRFWAQDSFKAFLYEASSDQILI